MKLSFLLFISFAQLSAYGSLLSPVFQCDIDPTSGFSHRIEVLIHDRNQLFFEVFLSEKEKVSCGKNIESVAGNPRDIVDNFIINLADGNCVGKKKIDLLKGGYIKIEGFSGARPIGHAYLLKGHQPFQCLIKKINRQKLERLTDQ